MELGGTHANSVNLAVNSPTTLNGSTIERLIKDIGEMNMGDKKSESKPASKEEMAEAAELVEFAADVTAAGGVAEVAGGMDTLDAAADVAAVK